MYEYECAKDGRFELIRRFSDPPLKKCPTCGRPVEKLVSASAFQFKGTGWYVTDYARKSEAKSNGTDGAGKKNGEANGEAKDAGGKKNGEAKSTDSSASKDTSKDAKASTPTTSTSKDSSASRGSSPT
jgi:putative FmdB family regulatory protein